MQLCSAHIHNCIENTWCVCLSQCAYILEGAKLSLCSFYKHLHGRRQSTASTGRCMCMSMWSCDFCISDRGIDLRVQQSSCSCYLIADFWHPFLQERDGPDSAHNLTLEENEPGMERQFWGGCLWDRHWQWVRLYTLFLCVYLCVCKCGVYWGLGGEKLEGKPSLLLLASSS